MREKHKLSSLVFERFRLFSADRIQWMASLIVCCFISMLLLSSQSRASYPSYVLGILMIATIPKWIDLFRSDLACLVGLLVAWLCISSAWSDPFDAQSAISICIRGLLVFSFLAAFAESQFRDRFQRWMGLGMTLVGALASTAAIINFFVTNPSDGRLNGMGQLDTHVIAALIYGVIGLFSLHTFVTRKEFAIRLGCVVAIVVVVVAVYLSDSRNAWISVVLGMGAYILAVSTNDVWKFMASLFSFAVIGGAIVLALIMDPVIGHAFLPRGTSFRLDIWAGVWNSLSTTDLIWGRGITSPEEVVVGTKVFHHPHNIYLAVLAQGGCIALLLFFAILLKTGLELFRSFGNAEAKLAISILILGLSSHILDGHELIDKIGSSWFLIWLPIATAVGLNWTRCQATDTRWLKLN